MQYLVSLLNGIATFLSPCLLLTLPIYIAYFAGGGQRSTGRTVSCALGFVLGFTAMGALAGRMGRLLLTYQQIVNLVSGSIVIVFGMNYLGLFRWNLFRGGSRVLDAQDMTFFSAALFGIIFSAGCTPCAIAFPVSTLTLTAQHEHIAQGVVMLLSYSLRLGIPFLFIAVLIDTLKGALGWVKRLDRIVNLLSGSFLVLAGLLMASGLLGRLLRKLC